ncbi:MAG TPA: hypothetical protein PKK10_07465 [Woeseiaceae bacterium]|nr:hypothetical protein [Woeseiaceae bacterium]
MPSFRIPGLVAALAIANMASADVTSVAPGGFVVEHEQIVRADRALVWDAAIADIGQWWNSAHTVAGDASRLSIDARPMGCFCETLPGDDGVVHLVVTSVSRGVMLRLTGGLGPLGLMGATGNMTWEFFDTEAGTRVKLMYAVGGYREGGFESIAGPVDSVLGEALSLLRAYVEAKSGNPDSD